MPGEAPTAVTAAIHRHLKTSSRGCIIHRIALFTHGSICAKGIMTMRSDIVPGTVFPDYELPDHTTKRRKLSELQGQDPMVLVLGRGGYCPKDRRMAEGL